MLSRRLIPLALIIISLVIVVIILLLRKPSVQPVIPPVTGATVPSIPLNSKFKVESYVTIDKTGDSRALGYNGQTKLVQDSKGRFYAAYRKKFEKFYEIFVARIDGTKTEFTQNPISVIGATQRVPSLTIDENDVLHVVWYGLDEEKTKIGRQIKYSSSSDYGKTWTKPKDIAFVSDYDGEDYWQEHPVIVSHKGVLYVVWEGKDKANSKQQVKLSKSFNGSSWTSWENIAPAKGYTQSRPVLAIDKKTDTFYVFYYASLGGDNQRITVTSSKNYGNVWSKPEFVSPEEFDARHISVLSPNDEIYAIWRQGLKSSKGSKTAGVYKGADDWKPLTLSPYNYGFEFFPVLGFSKKDQTLFYTYTTTLKESDFPKEDPVDGKGYIGLINTQTKADTEGPIELDPKKLILFPSALSVTNFSDSGMYILYSVQKDSDTYEIKLAHLTAL